jgi:hypothetical protein
MFEDLRKNKIHAVQSISEGMKLEEMNMCSIPEIVIISTGLNQ